MWKWLNYPRTIQNLTHDDPKNPDYPYEYGFLYGFYMGYGMAR